MEFLPQIKTSENISESTAEKIEQYSKEERLNLLGDFIKINPEGRIIKKDSKKNDIWLRKKVGKNLVGVDAMKADSHIRVIRGQYFPDDKDGNKEKLFLYCEVDNNSTVHGGKSGKDRGWIYAGYVNMDMPKIETVTTKGIREPEPKPEPKPTDKIDPIPPYEENIPPFAGWFSETKGIVLSPFNGKVVDITGFSPGTPVKCPYTGKIFRVPFAQGENKNKKENTTEGMNNIFPRIQPLTGPQKENIQAKIDNGTIQATDIPSLPTKNIIQIGDEYYNTEQQTYYDFESAESIINVLRIPGNKEKLFSGKLFCDTKNKKIVIIDEKSVVHPISVLEKEGKIEAFNATDIQTWRTHYYQIAGMTTWGAKDTTTIESIGKNIGNKDDVIVIYKKNETGTGVEKVIAEKQELTKVSISEGLFQNIENGGDVAKALTMDFQSKIETSTLIAIKEKANEIKGSCKTEGEIIKKTYEYIIDTTSYEGALLEYYNNLRNGIQTTKPNVSGEIHSGIKTFENKIGVCDGYSELMLLLLSFAGVKNVSVVSGKSSMSGRPGDPTGDHAWNKIGNLYYDVTGGDTSGQKDKYFGMSEEKIKEFGYELK